MNQNFGSLQNIHQKIQNQERLSFEDGLQLFQSTDILSLGTLAQSVRNRLHGKRVYYSVNLHLNHTNICPTRCNFCSFSRSGNEPDAYAFSLEDIEKKIAEAVQEWNINEVHMVGGHNPDLKLDYYIELFRNIKRNFPQIFIKALSAPEIDDLAKRSGISTVELLRILKEAGLESLPGGGAEIFEPRIRKQICPQKITGEEWLTVHRTAHQTGLSSNATMLYGHIETDEDRIRHMLELRNLQDETRGFRSFVPLAYNPGQFSSNGGRDTTGFLDLKVLSISRLMLDNIPHIKIHWSATDLKFAQAALSFGVDDMGGTNLHERVMHAAGSAAPGELSSTDLVRLITDADYTPCLVNSSYSPR